ncbi:MAG: YeeE/YedE thiosulfate transporter family protein [Actinomycetota bacterium]|jgi:uncharacterized membrane protein YedE/YeeE|nr:hypothetical protein [Actinomycetota bacterium]MCH2616322.1 YeeE/YedE family protein [Acidimicrobiales bacterium]MED5230586.1 YeeE/YedE thiosulfate transporter family protein [Actinomycetota bacterium]MED5446549.1 YeeE/YedE thiosulfate transporter family protein [Actinomycetota bacterium]|tara:strand:+ start:699 stop:1196 length:498 start_codon:yes stop_codon:yes gene_type:complete
MPDKMLFGAMLPQQADWYILGPILGVITVCFFLMMNQPLGASGAYIHTMNHVRRVGDRAAWRVWYFAGLGLGGYVVTQFLQDSKGLRIGFDSFRNAAPIWVMVPAIFIGGILIGYGAKLGGGCTSGHGICGTAQRSKSSIAATVTFMTSAILTTGFLRLISGGKL